MEKFSCTMTAVDIKDLVGDNPLMLEIGCHEGSDTLKFLKEMRYAFIHCFDPEERATKRFENSVGNDLRVQLHKVAISDVDGLSDFYASTGKAGCMKDWDFSGSLRKPTGHLTRSPEISFKDPAPVKCMRLDTWYTIHARYKAIDFIWADVQGSQRLVIAGGCHTLSNTRYLYIESHNPVAYDGEPTQAELIDLLSEWFEPIAIYAKENILLKNKEESND